MDYAVEKCIDSDGNQRCSAPFLVTKDSCYEIEWSTEGTLTHTTVEVRDAKSAEIVYYRDTNGQWTPEKGEVSFDQHLLRRLQRSNSRGSLSTSTSNRKCTRPAMTPSSTRSQPVRMEKEMPFCEIVGKVTHGSNRLLGRICGSSCWHGF